MLCTLLKTTSRMAVSRRWVSSVSACQRIFTSFEERCQKIERVPERDFAKTFDFLTRFINGNPELDKSTFSLHAAMLLRCCGRLMSDTPLKGRELLAGNVWTFIKEKQIPLDISHYNSLIKILNENGTVTDPQKLLDEIAAAKLVPDRITYQRLIHQYSLQGDIQGATSLLEKMKDLDMPLNEQIFASLITCYSKQEKPPTISEIFDLMRSNGVEPAGKSYAAAFIALASRGQDDPQAMEEFTKVFEMMEKDEVQLSSNELFDLINKLMPLKSSEAVSKLLDSQMGSLEGPVNMRYRILSECVKANQLAHASSLFWSQKVSQKAMQAGNVGTYWLQVLGRHHNVPVEMAIEECTKLREKGYNSKPFQQLYYAAAEAGRLDLVRAAMKKMVEEIPMKVQFAWPLLAQAKDENDFIQTLKNDIDPRMDSNELVETFSQWVWPRFSDNVARLFELNKELGYDNNILMASFLNYSVQENKIMEAIKFISEAPKELVGGDVEQSKDEDDVNEDMEPSVTPRLSRNQERGSLISRLLTQIAEQTKDPELVKKAFNMCQLPKQGVSPRNLMPLVRVHLLNDDFKGAIEEFLRISRDYRITPCRSELMSLCLVNKDPDNLQKVMNVTTEIYGEQNSLFDLAVSCLKNGKLKQAQKIFASPGFRVRPVRVYQMCRSLARQNNVDVLENFVNLTRDMYDVNQEYLYQILIDTYERTKNPKRALHLWNMMQEEEFQPSRRSLSMIADVLEKHNIEVPFQRPK